MRGSRRRWGLSSALSTIGGTALGIGGTTLGAKNGELTDLGRACLILGLSLIVLAGLIAMYLLIRAVGERHYTRAFREGVRRIVQRGEYDTRPARAADLQKVYDYAVTRLGPDILSVKRMKTWHQRNPRTFCVIVPKDNNRVVGAYSLISLNTEADELLSTDLLDARGILAKYIVSSRKRASCHYIGGIAGDTLHIRALALQSVKMELSFLPKGHRIYTRPLTRDGMRLCKKYDFHHVSPDIDPEKFGALYVAELA